MSPSSDDRMYFWPTVYLRTVLWRGFNEGYSLLGCNAISTSPSIACVTAARMRPHKTTTKVWERKLQRDDRDSLSRRLQRSMHATTLSSWPKGATEARQPMRPAATLPSMAKNAPDVHRFEFVDARAAGRHGPRRPEDIDNAPKTTRRRFHGLE